MKYIIKISYDGKNYKGFQRQKNGTSIQEEIEKAFETVLGYEVSLIGSGRTDAGVSAIEQVCHIETSSEIDTARFVGYSNSLLPNDIRVLECARIDDDFHARYSAKKKTYQYYFYVGKMTIPVYDKFATHLGYNLDILQMQKACEYFLGEHDFTAFCASNTSVADKVRTIYSINIRSIDNCLYVLEVTGNGFLYNMVRIIMGTLLEVGIGKITPEKIIEIINSEDRRLAGKTVEAKGLCLKKVLY